MIRISSYINLCICLSGLKILLLKSYVSTDFDVHRNWMAITYNLPLSKWYFDNTSEWTLDYPPLFAAFEFCLSLTARLFNIQDALRLSPRPIRTDQVIIFQKLTVIISDIVYYIAIYRLCDAIRSLMQSNLINGVNLKPNDKKPVDKDSSRSTQLQNLSDAINRPNATSLVALLLVFQPGLILVDHIHFQYNGMLSGLLILSIANIISHNYASGAFYYALLLNFKHIYIYCAPAFGMYLLVCYCFARVDKENRLVTCAKRIAKLGSIVIGVFLISFIPFANYKTMQQIISRLFPFKRGLTHAYWAPNLWALYNFLDKILATVYKDSLKVKFDIDSISRTRTISSTSGLVQEYEHQYLPSIHPLITFALVAAFTGPVVIKFLTRVNKKSPQLFLKAVTLTSFTSFMFGWHVHEKAIILVLLPMVPSCILDHKLNNTFLRMTLAGTYSLFPLLFKPAEFITRASFLLSYFLYAQSMVKLQRRYESKEKHTKMTTRGKLVFYIDKLYMILLILNELYIVFLHGRLNHEWNPLAQLNKYEFLPLMSTSTLTAIGIGFSYLELYYDFVFCPVEELAT